MPFRKDHLQLVTDAGATLDIGWAYGTPYSLDPINGVDVDVQTALGVNQVGVSVERQSVAGVSRELIIHCHSSHGVTLHCIRNTPDTADRGGHYPARWRGCHALPLQAAQKAPRWRR